MFQNTKQTHDREYFTIFDSKVGAYRTPLLALNKHDILRQLDMMYSDPKASEDPLVTHSEDFQLFKIANYTLKTGAIQGHHPEHIANLHDVKLAARKRLENHGALVST